MWRSWHSEDMSAAFFCLSVCLCYVSSFFSPFFLSAFSLFLLLLSFSPSLHHSIYQSVFLDSPGHMTFSSVVCFTLSFRCLPPLVSPHPLKSDFLAFFFYSNSRNYSALPARGHCTIFLRPVSSFSFSSFLYLFYSPSPYCSFAKSFVFYMSVVTEYPKRISICYDCKW